MEYLLKASIVLVIFYGCYKLFLQRDTFFESNRWFLLIGLMAAFTLPFIIIPIYIEYTPTPIQNITYSEVPIEVTEAPVSIWHYIFNIYLIGVACFALHFFIQLASLLWLIAKNKKQKQQGYTFVETTNSTPPFSFFRWMVYNPNQFSKAELEHIISHENVHVTQFHTIDIIMSQLATIVFWFNPISWYYKKDLQQNLEFIADYKALHANTNTKSYEKLLLKTCVPDLNLALTNNFYSSLIKKRIVMLHKSKSKKRNLIKYAFVLPFLAIFLMSFNTEEVYVTKTTQGNNTLGKIAETYIIKKSTSTNELENIKEEITNNGGTFAYTQKRNSKNEIVELVFEIKNHGTGNYESEPPFKEVYFGTLKGGGIFIAEDEKNYKDMLNEENNTLNNVTPKKTSLQKKQNNQENLSKTSHSQNNVRPFSITITNDFTDEDFEKAIEKAKKHETILKFSKIKRNSGYKIISITTKITHNGHTKILAVAGDPIKAFTCYLNEEEVGFGKPNDSYVNGYGKQDNLSNIKVIGYGVNKTIYLDSIYFNKPNNNHIFQSDSIKALRTIDGKTPLFILDDKEVSESEIQKLDKNKIQSISILKDETASVLYGDKAKDGVVIITTKKDWETKFVIGKAFNSNNNQEEFAVYGKITNEQGVGLPNADIIIKGTSSGASSGFKGNYSIKVRKGETLVFSDIGYITKSITVKDEKTINVTLKSDSAEKDIKKVLLIIDGKEEKNKTAEDLDANTIKSVNILKGEDAIRKYGDKGRNSVIEITTKKE